MARGSKITRFNMHLLLRAIGLLEMQPEPPKWWFKDRFKFVTENTTYTPFGY
jgi:hypothetical protein